MMIRCKLKHIALCCISAFSGFAVAAESIEYDANFLMGSSAAGIDLSRYSEVILYYQGNITRAYM